MAAGDSTEFTAKITVDSKQAEKNVENLGQSTEDTAEKFVSLRSQIRQTTVQLQGLADAGKVGTKEFEALRSKLDELNDAQDRVNFQAGQFDDQLAALPGPIGQVGQALQGFNESMVKFGKSTMIALGVVGLIITAFMAMKNSLESTAEGQETLNRITTAFQKILGPVMALIESVALPLFEGFANILGKVADGVAFVVEKLGISKQKIAEASSGVKDFKKVAEDLAKDQKEAADKAAADEKARQEKRDAKRKEALAKQKAIDDEAAKIQTEAALSLLDARTRELKERELRFAEEKKKILASNNKDLTNLNKEYNLDLASINKKFADEQLAKDKKDLEEQTKALDEFYKKQEEDAKKVADAKRELSFEQVQDEIAALDKKSLEVEGDFAADITRLEQKKTLLEEQKQIELSNAELTSAQKIKISRDYADKEAAIQKDITATQRAETEARQAINSAYLGLAQQFGNALTQMAGENKELAIAGVVISQAAAIGQIISQTGIANAKAVAASPLTGGMPWVAINTISAGISIASSISQGIKSIQQINAAGGPSVGGGGGGAMSAPSIQAPRVGTAATPVMAEGVGQNPSSQIAQTIGNSQNQVVRAYVVSQDITTQQQLDRKANSAAVF